MAKNYPNGVRPIPKVIQKPQPPTEEELMAKRLAYFAQKREGIAVHILGNMVQGEAFLKEDDAAKVVDAAAWMADRLLERLYPKPEEKK